MPDCSRIDPLVTPYVDGALSPDDERSVAGHVGTCPACQAKLVAERSVRALFAARRAELTASGAPADLKRRMATLRDRPPAPVYQFPVQAAGRPADPPRAAAPARSWASRVRPFALAASLVLIVGLAFLYQATRSSSRVLAAELAADHMKCFGLNEMLGTNHSHDTVEAAMASTFDWDMDVPELAESERLRLVGSRLCLYGEGKTAHIMFKHNGVPMSLFMLPHEHRDDQRIRSLGHQLRMWSVGDRTFVLVSREPADEVAHVASLVRASLR